QPRRRQAARVHGDRRRGEPGAAPGIAGAGRRGAGLAARLREGRLGSGGAPPRSGEAEGQVQARAALGDPQGQSRRDGGRVKRLVAASLLLLMAACDDEKVAAPDELTIVVQGDRREVEQLEKSVREREEALKRDKEQLDQRIADLAKGLKAAADAEQ